LKQSLIESSVAVSGKLAIANHLDSVGLVGNDTLVVFSLGMANIHSIYSNRIIYKLKNVNHIQIHTHTHKREFVKQETKNISKNFSGQNNGDILRR